MPNVISTGSESFRSEEKRKRVTSESILRSVQWQRREAAMLMDVIVPALVAGFAVLVIIGHVDLIKAAA